MTEEDPDELARKEARAAWRAEVKAWREDHPRGKKKAKKIKSTSTRGMGGVKLTHTGRIPPP